MPLTPKAPTLPGSRVLEERARGLASLCRSHTWGEAGICLPSQHRSLASNGLPLLASEATATRWNVPA